jgi:type I restriction enzyme S subunit
MDIQLPKNWVISSLKEVTRTVKGKKPKIQSEIEFENSIPYMDIKALEHQIIRKFADVESSKIFEEGDVAMVWDGARSGWVSKTNFGAIGSTITSFKPIKLNSDYLFYYLLNIYPYINSNARGVGIPHVDPTVLYSLEFPLPPLAEQQRIIAKLDELFGHLDSLKTRLSNIPQILKNFRQAVLTQAVTGKLTEEWRVGKELEEWSYKRAEDVCELITKGTTPKSGGLQKTGDVPFLKVYNIVHQKINFKYKPQFISNEINEKVLKRSIVYPETVIMNIVGPPLGKVAIIPNDYDQWNLNQALAIFRPLNCLTSIFVYYILIEGDPIKKISQDFKGVVGQSNISLAQCRDFIFPIPSKDEQTEIVKRVEHLFAKADAIEAQYQSLKTKIDSLPQAILAKAFKGELAAQLDTDGDAKVLLEEIQKLGESAVKKTFKGKKK